MTTRTRRRARGTPRSRAFSAAEGHVGAPGSGQSLGVAGAAVATRIRDTLVPIYATYALPVLLGLAVLFVFPLTKHMTRASDRHRYYVLQTCTLVGALLGAKLAALAGDLGWPVHPIPGGFLAALSSGRSITGGLLGGLLTAEALKPLLNYTLPPNDRFAAVLPFSIAIGRVGCVLTGCCAGLPHEGAVSMRDAHGVSRWPTQLFELVFQLVVGVTFMLLVRRGVLRGRLFSLYLVVYGLFRFGTEFLRDTPRFLAPLSVYQLLALLMVFVGGAMLAWRSRPGASTSVTPSAAPAASASVP